MTTCGNRASRRRRTWVAASCFLASGAALASVVACHELVDPPLPAGAEAFAAPAVFELWWNMTETCSKRTAPLSGVSWYVVRGARTINDGRNTVSGYWSAASNRIVLAEAAAQVGAVVRHEMLHSLLRAGGHPRQAFLNDCGGVVSCGEDCLRDAGPAPAAPASAIGVPAESLDVSVEITPASPTSALFDGHFALTVLARNVSTRPVVASLSGGFESQAVGFRFAIAASGRQLVYDEPVHDASETQFLPGETKRHVFDFVVGGPGQPWAIEPGTHRVEVAYGAHWSSPIDLDVSP